MGMGKFLVIILLILLSGFIYYSTTEPYMTGGTIRDVDKQNITILRAVDGDTIDSSIGKVRLLGINTPEKKQPYYQEARTFLATFENKTVQVEITGKDKYDRSLAYLFDGDEFVNKRILELGFANLYVYDDDKYTKELEGAEKVARDAGFGIWEKSVNYGCIELIKLQWDEGDERCVNAEQLILNNKCDKNLHVIIKDSANHIYNENLSIGLFIQNYSCVWNDAGDNLLIRDYSGFLLYYAYPGN